MAKFLQDTVEEMAITSSNPNKQEAVQEFANFFQRVFIHFAIYFAVLPKFGF